MSLSDKHKYKVTDSWEPLDIDSLQHIEEEKFIKTDNTAPDYNIFKRIYEGTENNGSEIFKPLYEFDSYEGMAEDDGGHGFEEIVPGSELNSDAGHDKIVTPDDTAGTGKSDDTGGNMQDSPGYDLELKKGFDEGKEEGFLQGRKKGEEQGYAEGYEKGEKQGYAEGYEKGENDAKKNCDASALEIINSLEDILLKTNDAWTEIVKKYEEKLLSLVCRIAEKVVLARVEIDDKLVKESIFNAMEKMPEPEEIILHVSPDDYEYIEMIKEDFFERIHGLTSISVVSDPSIHRGGCRIESAKAKIETDIESRLEAVFESIVQAGGL